jgi:hemoglobin
MLGRVGLLAGEPAVATIFERYGGFAAIRKVVSDLYDRLLDDPSLARHFADVDLRSLINHQTQFIAFVTGGPGVSYSDEALARVHRPLGITREEVRQMRALLRETLEDHGFTDADVATVDAELEAREHAIVGAP